MILDEGEDTLTTIESNKPYIISANTLCLQTKRKENRIQTLVVDKDKTFLHPRRPLHLIRSSCHHYNTTLEVVTRFAKKILNDRHKVPIAIAVDHGIPLIMIPTLAASSEQNIWIAFHAIKNFRPSEAGFTVIELTDNYHLKIQTSEATIQRQIALAYLLQREYQSKFFQFNRTWIYTPTPVR